MPLQCTLSCINLNENQPPKSYPLSLHPPAQDPPMISLGLKKQIEPLRGLAFLNSLSCFSPPCNLSTTIPYQHSLHYYKVQQMEEVPRDATSLTVNDSPSVVSAAPCGPVQPSQPCTVGLPIIKLPAMVMATSSIHWSSLCQSSLCQSSPLGPSQHLLPRHPSFPPSIHEPDLYRWALG